MDKYFYSHIIEMYKERQPQLTIKSE